MCCSVHCRSSAKGVDIDVLLALDYITSMQYFRIFRWDYKTSANRTMQLLSDADSRNQLWQSEQAFNEFLSGLKEVAEGVQTGLYKAVCAMLKSPIRAAVDEGQASTTKHWLCSAYDDLKAKHRLPEWPQENKRQDTTDWSPFDRGALKVWLDCKLSAESHTAGLHSNEDDRQFTETDRLVKSLLQAEVCSDTETNQGIAGKPGMGVVAFCRPYITMHINLISHDATYLSMCKPVT